MRITIQVPDFPMERSGAFKPSSPHFCRTTLEHTLCTYVNFIATNSPRLCQALEAEPEDPKNALQLPASPPNYRVVLKSEYVKLDITHDEIREQGSAEDSSW